LKDDSAILREMDFNKLKLQLDSIQQSVQQIKEEMNQLKMDTQTMMLLVGEVNAKLDAFSSKI
jgi:archaellum component FlaC